MLNRGIHRSIEHNEGVLCLGTLALAGEFIIACQDLDDGTLREEMDWEGSIAYNYFKEGALSPFEHLIGTALSVNFLLSPYR